VAAAAASLDGEVEGEEAERCVDVFLWLKIMLKCFREEQVNREAAVRVMFASAQHGNEAKEALARQAADRRAGLDPPPANDQFTEVQARGHSQQQRHTEPLSLSNLFLNSCF
jgi:hypothetical protein